MKEVTGVVTTGGCSPLLARSSSWISLRLFPSRSHWLAPPGGESSTDADSLCVQPLDTHTEVLSFFGRPPFVNYVTMRDNCLCLPFECTNLLQEIIKAQPYPMQGVKNTPLPLPYISNFPTNVQGQMNRSVGTFFAIKYSFVCLAGVKSGQN